MPTKTWYLEALGDGSTNETIANLSRAEIPALNTREDMLCIDGKKRNFWECSYSLIAKLLPARRAGRLHFKVFYREGMYGPVRLWPFTEKKRLTLVSAKKKGLIRFIHAR